MGNDEHISEKAVYLNYFNKKQLFHVINDDFPVPEDGIIGMQFFKKYDRYAITPRFLIIENFKLLLQQDGEFISGKHRKSAPSR